MTAILHPGDLGLFELAIVGIVYLTVTAVPILIIAFVIYKVVNRLRTRQGTSRATL